jgi:putative ABC transport system permease protein
MVRPTAAARTSLTCTGEGGSMSRVRFWIRWSLRDLRERWVLVVAIALTIALGTGGFAGMTSTTEWRRTAINASAAALAMHDLRLELAEGSAVPSGQLRAILAALPDPSVVTSSAERLRVPVAVDASVGGETILVPGVLVGVDLAGGTPVDRVAADAGRDLVAADDLSSPGSPITVALEYRFARFHGLAPEGSLTVAGRAARYVGQASTPEMFVVMGEGGSMFAEAGYAGVFAGLRTAQDVAGMPGLVNDLVLRLSPGADRAIVATDLARVANAMLPGVGSRVLTRDDDPAWRMIVGDTDTDGQFFAIFALLILLGAAFASFNLATRVVEAQRRQVGIGMALGVPGPLLALRPVLVGAEIAVLGVALGVPVGIAFDEAMLTMLRDLMPLPVFEAPLQVGPFLAAAAIGLVVPVVATVLPVRRAVRMSPVEAIHAGPRSVRGSGLAGLASRLPLPGGSLGRAPVRNILRAPRRSLLTAMGIGAAIAVLVSMAAMMDTFDAAVAAGERATVAGHPDRMSVELADFMPLASVAEELDGIPAIGSASPGLRLGAVATVDARKVELVLDLVDTSATGWRPVVLAGSLPAGTGDGSGGILLAEGAAAELGVGVGDTVALRHPRRTGPTAVDTVESRVRVVGLHASPIRAQAWMDLRDAELMSLAGVANFVDVEPAAGYTQDDVARALFGRPGVAAAQPVTTLVRIYRSLLEEFTGVLAVSMGLGLLLAFLVAFNSASIATDERAREHATMLAFGVPVTRLLGIEMMESAVLGMAGTSMGLGLGLAAVAWMVEAKMDEMLPDLSIRLAIAPGTVLAAAGVGIVVVGLAPVLMARRLRRMDLPGTLRLVE